MSVGLIRSSRRALATITRQTRADPLPRLQQQQQQQQRNASRIAARIPFTQTQPAFPTVASCPAPTCQCRETPAGLDIERSQPLNGTMAAYAGQVLISTGQPDWTSRIEDEEDAVFLRMAKKFLGRGGRYSDPFHNVLLTNSSFAPSPSSSAQQQATREDASRAPPPPPPPPATASAFLLPTFEYIPHIPLDESSVAAFIKAFVLPTHLHPHHEALTDPQKETLLRDPQLQTQFPQKQKVREALVLICGHGGRDARCGVLGPLLASEFEEKIQARGIRVLRAAPGEEQKEEEAEKADKEKAERGPEQVERRHIGGGVAAAAARVGLISHIGGHKFAGNVIVYIPDAWVGHPLAGKGVWYGRVEPAHVEGIVDQTVLEGKVIVDHFRGGVGQGGEVMRL